MKTIKVALLGNGNVGSQVARFFLEKNNKLNKRAGGILELIGIGIKDKSIKRDFPSNLYTNDLERLILKADIVVELIGGIYPAKNLILKALKNKSIVISGNKTLLAQFGKELHDTAYINNTQLLFEASVCGAIPIIRSIKESLSGDNITKILGIVNGTTNYILNNMYLKEKNFDTALKEAQDLGYAESDPTSDIEGYDAAAKACILSSLAFHTNISINSVYRQGISNINPIDIKAAKEANYIIKLLAVCEKIKFSKNKTKNISVRVSPALLPKYHALANVNGVFNAVFIKAELAGELMFYGQGAGGIPTSSAVLGDLISCARRIILNQSEQLNYISTEVNSINSELVQTCYYIGIEAFDNIGTLAKITEVFAKNKVSIATIKQTLSYSHRTNKFNKNLVHLRVITHQTSGFSVKITSKNLTQINVVKKITSVMRIEG